MKVLVIVGECIQVNTSSNLCNLAYLRGLVELGNKVTLLSADKQGYVVDPNMKIPVGVESYTYRSMTLYERLSRLFKNQEKKVAEGPAPVSGAVSHSGRKSLLRKLKKIAFDSYGPYGVYIKFAYRAAVFHSKEEYDLVITLSNPASSHLLGHKLLKLKQIRSRHWVQIWEDPWYCDVDRGPKTKAILREEKRLLSVADRICYVSPITLKYQKQMYPESAAKMFWAPLPAYYDDLVAQNDKNAVAGTVFGYFGEYYLPARNLIPFYEAAKATEISVNICGNTNIKLKPTDQIHVFPRLNLEDLRPIEQITDVLVFLCNCKGGQIPGKIYQYSATRKTILFILDGTEEEKQMLRDCFEQYRRFVFCENNPKEIEQTIRMIVNGRLGDVVNDPLTAFRPKTIVKRILDEVL